MVTKEECLNALKTIEDGTTEIEDYESIPYVTSNQFAQEISVLKQLINEHFDNPPLRFEELEVGMRVWDNEDCDYYTIAELLSHEFRDEYCIIFKGYEDYLDKFKPNRFYRWEVKE